MRGVLAHFGLFTVKLVFLPGEVIRLRGSNTSPSLGSSVGQAATFVRCCISA